MTGSYSLPKDAKASPTAPKARYDADKEIPRQGFRRHNAAQNKSALLMESRHVITSHHHRAPRPEIPLL